MQTPQVRRTLFYIPRDAGDITLAEMSDGHYCILQNQRPLNGMRWKPNELDEALEMFQQLQSNLSKRPSGK